MQAVTVKGDKLNRVPCAGRSSSLQQAKRLIVSGR
jgi:hypothetical protein